MPNSFAFSQGTPKLLHVGFVTDSADVTWTNMPLAATLYNGVLNTQKIDLTNYKEARLLVLKKGTAAVAGAKVRLRFATSFSGVVGGYSTMGTAEIQVSVDATNTMLDSGWIALVATARADVFVIIDGIGGDGAVDPVFGNISAEFR